MEAGITGKDEQLAELVNRLDRQTSNSNWLGVVSLVILSLSIVGLIYFVWTYQEQNIILEKEEKISRLDRQFAREELEKVSERLDTLSDSVDDSAVQEIVANLEKTQNALGTDKKGEALADDFRNTRVDIFYCTDKSGLLEKLAYKLNSTKPSSVVGRWRVKLISDAVNSRAGYRSIANEIRFEPGEELFAEWLKGKLASSAGISLKFREIPSQTPEYVSVFFCQGANLIDLREAKTG